jgi:hypothetical protein
MYKIINGQWQTLTEEDIPQYRKQDGSYQDWLQVSSENVSINVSIRQDNQEQQWKADIQIDGNAKHRTKVTFHTTVYIDQFPDLLALLRDADVLERLVR